MIDAWLPAFLRYFSVGCVSVVFLFLLIDWKCLFYRQFSGGNRSAGAIVPPV